MTPTACQEPEAASRRLPPDAQKPFLMGARAPDAVKKALRAMIWRLHRYQRLPYGHIAVVAVFDHDIHLMYATGCPAERVAWIGPDLLALVNMFARAWIEGVQPYQLFEYAEAEQARRDVGRIIVLPDHVCDLMQAPNPFYDYVLRHRGTQQRPM